MNNLDVGNSQERLDYERDRSRDRSSERNFSPGPRIQESWYQAAKSNPKALFWCFYALFTCIIWGYDGLSGTIVLGIDQFRQDYGDVFQDQFVVPASWQLVFAAGSLIGLLLGGIAALYLAKFCGQRLCMLIANLFLIVGIFLLWFSAPGGRVMFAVAKFFTGLPLGIFITIVPPYCSELAPLPLRGAVTGAVNFSIVFGQFLVYVVTRQTQHIDNANSYRIIFAVEWAFAGVALILLPFFPESPYHLIARGKINTAEKTVRKLHQQGFDSKGYISTIIMDLDNEKQTRRKASFVECFRGKNLQRTLIAMSTFFIQNVSGISWMIGYMAYFLELGGLSTDSSFNVTLAISGIMVIGNLFGWIFIERAGRRSTAFWGSLILTIALLLIGIMSVISLKGAIWAQIAFMAVWSFTYEATIGSVAWPIVTEVSSSALRSHTQSLATVSNGLVGAIVGVVLPYAMNPDQANLGGRIAFIFGAVLGVSTIFIWWFYPETKGRTFLEIDTLFEMGVPPRRFARTKLDDLSHDNIRLIEGTGSRS